MPGWVGPLLAVAGGAISAVGLPGTVRFYRRFFEALRSRPADRREATIQRLDILASGSAHLIVEGVGVTLILGGVVMTSAQPPSLVFVGVVLTLAAASSALTLRWAVRRLR